MKHCCISGAISLIVSCIPQLFDQERPKMGNMRGLMSLFHNIAAHAVPHANIAPFINSGIIQLNQSLRSGSIGSLLVFELQ